MYPRPENKLFQKAAFGRLVGIFFFFFISSNLTNRHTFPYFHNYTFIHRRLYCTSKSWSLDGPVGIRVRRSNLLFIQVKTLTGALKFIFFGLSNYE